MFRAVLLVLLLIVSVSTAASSQKEPRRPKLPAAADTNSAGAYYEFGLNSLRDRPDQAFAAFHWATRIEPGWAEPLYAKRVAYHLTYPQRLEDYLLRRGYARSKEVRSIDSLQNEALLRNPVLFRGHDSQLLFRWFENETGRSANSVDWRGPNPWFNGWMAYTQARFPQALKYFAEALQRTKNDYSTHVDRALVFHQLSQIDSAVAELRMMVSKQEASEQKEVVTFYDSKAFAMYMIGFMYETTGRAAEAKEAYDRVVAEDLSFYMAHFRLGDLAWARSDTATYLQEYQLAVDLKPTSPFLQERLGAALLVIGRPAEAAPHLAKAVELEPLFATARLALALALDATGAADSAATNYSRYLDIAPRHRQRERKHAEDRLAALKGKSQ